eukprot:TRINITY_DN6252_c0_g2_i1.p1 TRINITY_DN6252_c0_g2~~TRINITY_DN6252_c0_g2_i1.p1  ORF type:complete len:258 (+),score=39.79 TRINITY_DN6252_c0_g2_i1:64-837(+)
MPSRTEADRSKVRQGGVRPLKTKQRLTRPARKKDRGKEPKPKQEGGDDKSGVQWWTANDQAEWFSSQFRSVYGSMLSTLEQDTVAENRLVQLEAGKDHSLESMRDHVISAIGPAWEEILCGTKSADGGSGREAGSISMLVLCSSANRCVDILRALKTFCIECQPAKLFAKHMKVEEQVQGLKRRVNIAAGTPNRVKKLVDIGALGLGDLSLVLLDMHKDAKGLTVLTVPDVKKDFWELYVSHLRERLLSRQLRLCIY